MSECSNCGDLLEHGETGDLCINCDDQMPDAEIERLLSLEATGEEFSSVYDMIKELSDYEFLQEFVDHCEERRIDLG